MLLLLDLLREVASCDATRGAATTERGTVGCCSGAAGMKKLTTGLLLLHFEDYFGPLIQLISDLNPDPKL